jgi:hypothetical protein
MDLLHAYVLVGVNANIMRVRSSNTPLGRPCTFLPFPFYIMAHFYYERALPAGEIAVGLTKVFIKSPKTVDAIEKAFQSHKNYIATRIQACFRGYKQRKAFLKMRNAAVAAQKFARVVLAQQWAVKRKAAVDNVRKFIKGFIHRNDPVSEVNQMFVVFARKFWLKRLIDALPKNVLDKSWIPDTHTPSALKEASEYVARGFVFCGLIGVCSRMLFFAAV